MEEVEWEELSPMLSILGDPLLLAAAQLLHQLGSCGFSIVSAYRTFDERPRLHDPIHYRSALWLDTRQHIRQ